MIIEYIPERKRQVNTKSKNERPLELTNNKKEP